MDESLASDLPPRAAEAFLIDQIHQEALPEVSGTALTSTRGRGQLAHVLMQSRRCDHVDCWFTDQYQWAQADRWHRQQASSARLLCQADAPDQTYASGWLPLGRRGETEWVREQIQCMFNAVETGGFLIVAVNNPQDRWVIEQLQRLPCSIQRLGDSNCSGYVCRKKGSLKKQKNYRCEFAFRHRDHLLKIVSRPSVFSHRRIDPGARHILNALPTIDPDWVLDIGCGAGTLCIAAAAMYRQATVMGIDSNTRAVQCTLASAGLNGLDNVDAAVSENGQIPHAGRYDLVLANPPYYADFRIAELFIQTAHRALTPGGRLLLVGKDPTWYQQRMPEQFKAIQIDAVKGYVVVSALKP